MNAQEPDWDALARLVAGESDPAEVLAVEAWLASHPLDAAVIRTVKGHSEFAEASMAQSIQVEAAWAAVRSRMKESGEDRGAPAPELSVIRGGRPRHEPQIVPLTDSRASGGRWGRYALAAAAAVLGMFGLRQWQGQGSAENAERVVVTAVGVRDSMTLSDGTKVILAPGSRLLVAAGFERSDRSVTLEGAAYFDVKHDDAHPFTIHAAGAEIRDLGTTFSVKTDAVGGVSVAVTHGIVSVREMASTARSAVELRAGDRGVVSGGAVAVTRGTVTEVEMAWTRGLLTYRDAPLVEVQADLKRWYGINMLVADSALSRLTVTMQVQQDSARVVRTIAAMFGADVEQRGDTLILHSAGRGTKP